MSGIAPATSNDFDAQYDAETLTRAAEIKADPDRHSRARAHAQKKLAALKKVAGGPAASGAETQLSKGYRKI